jgi:hypothetical protein
LPFTAQQPPPHAIRTPSPLGGLIANAVTLFVCSKFLFALIEEFPSLVNVFHLSSIHYFALRERYLVDDTLVFRMRPDYRMKLAGYRGGCYKAVDGLDVPPWSRESAFDHDGFRDRTSGRGAEIVAVGDSFIEIAETDETLFTTRLQTLSGLQTANLGVAWYGPFQYLEVFKRIASPRSRTWPSSASSKETISPMSGRTASGRRVTRTITSTCHGEDSGADIVSPFARRSSMSRNCHGRSRHTAPRRRPLYQGGIPISWNCT